MTAYYNEFDPQVAAWLRVLIAEGHIAPGVVDERSIEDVRPSDLRGFKQCHFFAGIGVWSYALRRAGWRDDRPIWTGSCPCQPFSAAGKGAGFDDERHLWPAFQWLIQECKPASILGEQVASAAVDDWIDLVHADLEALGYAFGSVPFPAAGVGAPHIRDRNYWVAHADSKRSTGQRILLRSEESGREPRRILETAGCGAIGGLADTDGGQRDGFSVIRGVERNGQDAGRSQGGGVAEPRCDAGGLDHSNHARLEGLRSGHQAEGGWIGAAGPTAEASEPSGLADPRNGSRQRSESRPIVGGLPSGVEENAAVRPGPTNGYWRDSDWLGCRDGKWRPVEPGTFPLVTGASARVVRLRGYGNAVNAEQARAWIETVMECLPC